jgi:hypothetical protein
VYRALAEARPDAFLPDLAISCGTLGTSLKNAGRDQEAFTAFAEGIRALRAHFQAIPMAHAQLMLLLVQYYLALAEELDQEPDVEMLAPIMEKLTELYRSGPFDQQ